MSRARVVIAVVQFETDEPLRTLRTKEWWSCRLKHQLIGAPDADIQRVEVSTPRRPIRDPGDGSG